MAKQVLHKKKILEGVVTADKMDKTISVKVERKLLHPVYKKIVVKHKKIKAHDFKNKAKVGDRVRIIESRPFSKDTRFNLIEVIV